jgi:hypothetical protein
MNHNKNIALLVVSCDHFSEWWNIFFQRKEKFWPGCTYDTFLLSNEKEYSRKGVENIRTGVDKDWSSNLLFALNKINHKKVLLMLEDAPFNKFVEDDKFITIVNKFEENKIKYLNLKSSPKPPLHTGDLYSIYPPNLPYRAALVPCIWDVETLKILLTEGESAWQFEIRGSKRSASIKEFYALNEPFFNLLHCVIKGKIDLRAYFKLKETGELSLVNKFPAMTKFEFIKVVLSEFRGFLFSKLPYKKRNLLRDFIYGNLLKKKDWV